MRALSPFLRQAPIPPSRRAPWALAGMLALLSACGGGSGEAEPLAREQSAGLNTAAPGALTEQVRTLLRSRRADRSTNPNLQMDRWFSPGAELTTTGSVVAHPPNFSNTTVQEAGVDEADLLKTDGQRLYAMDSYTLKTERGTQHQLRAASTRSDGGVTPLSTLPLVQEDGYPTPRGLLLAATAPRLVALTEHLVPVGLPQPCPEGMACAMPTSLVWAPTRVKAHVQVQAAELASNGAATLGTRLDIDGRLVTSRRVGNVVYLVTTHTPRLQVDELPSTAPQADVDAALLALRPNDYLPQVRINGGTAQPLLNETECLLQPGSSSRTIAVTTVVAIDLASPTLARSARCFLGGTEALYMSTSQFYLATTRAPTPVVQSDGRVVYASGFVTDIHKFAFSGLDISYRASGEVQGHLGWDAQRMALRMSEHAGDLRVLTFTGGTGWMTLQDRTHSVTTPSPARLTVLRERTSDRTLQTLATLPNTQRPGHIGKPGEQIHGVRFLGDRAYVVTFRQVDPLYVLDLTNPADPKVAGELEMPGFSDLLLPLPNGLLFGVGREADEFGLTTGVKVALFDVADATRPRLLANQVFGARGSASGVDYTAHALNLLQVGNVTRLALPMLLRSTDFGPDVTRGLHRFEVDTTARTLSHRGTLAAAPSNSDFIFDLSGDRSLQLGDTLFYLSQGQLLGQPWAP
jgi:hypothetical protein